jgi:hypothetical protein
VIKEKEKEKEDDHEKTSNEKTLNDKTKILDKLKTTAKIKRPVISLKPNANSKTNTTGYETNVTSTSKSPLASNFASEKPNLKAEKKVKESKDDSNLKHKRPLENQPETGKLDKTHRVEKKTSSNNNVNEDAEAKNLVNNLAAKKSSNKIATPHTAAATAKKPSEKLHANNGEKPSNHADANDNNKNKKDSDKNVDKSSKANEKLKDKKDSKTSSKLVSSNFFK